MSITTQPKRLLFNTLSSTSVDVAAGVVSIEGLPAFYAADVVAGSCYRVCPAACTKSIWTITPVVPSAPCECPWAYRLRIVTRICPGFGIRDTFAASKSYDYVDPAGGVPTVAQITASITAQINSDPTSNVVAVDNTTTITLTEKNCDSGNGRTCGFDPYQNSGTAVNGTPYVAPVLPADEVLMHWPILPGSEFGNPARATCGDYCKYVFEINPINRVHDPHLANAYVDRFLRVEIWVNSDDATFAANWDTPMTTILDCLGAAL